MDLDDDADSRDWAVDPFFAVFDKMRVRRVSSDDDLELADDDPLAGLLKDGVTTTSTPPIRRRLAPSCDWSFCLASAQADLASSFASASSSRRLSDAGRP